LAPVFFGGIKPIAMRLRHLTSGLLFTLLSASLAFGQEPNRSTTPNSTSAQEREEFLKFMVPALLNGAKIDPAPVTNLAIDFGEDRVTFKTGAQLDRRGKDGYRYTFTAAPYIGSEDQVSTVFSKGKGITDYGIALGLNYVWRTDYTALQPGVERLNHRLCRREIRKNRRFRTDTIEVEGIAVGDLVSHRAQWFAVRSFLDQQNFTLFDTTAAFNGLQSDRSLGLGQVYVSYNKFFRSLLPKYRVYNAIWSIGLGYASFTNYKQLDERELVEGSIIYNADSTAYRTIAETTEGRAGQLKVRSGLALYGEVYKDIVPLPNNGTIRLGVRYTHYAPGTADENSIFSGGLFITTKKKPEGGKSEDSANFSITVRMDQFQKRNEADYLDGFAKVMVGAAIPLRF
jgi:hypothetical protein